jgi:[citrate (pro-3S)-lyase] ligase
MTAIEHHDCSFAKRREKENEILVNLCATANNNYSIVQYLLDNNIEKIILFGDYRYPKLSEAVLTMFRLDGRVEIQQQFSNKSFSVRAEQFYHALGESTFTTINTDTAGFKPSDIVLVLAPNDDSLEHGIFKPARVFYINKIIQLCAFFITQYRGLYMFAATHPTVRVLACTWPVTFPNDMSDGARASGDTVVSMLRSGEVPMWLRDLGLDSQQLLALFNQPHSYLTESGAKRYFDCAGEHLTITGGLRVTVDQPTQAEHRMFVFGPCTFFGYGGTDSGTVASYLQHLINNKTQEKILCENHGMYFFGIGEAVWKDLFSLSINEGDFVVMACSSVPSAISLTNSLPNLSFIDLVRLFEPPYEYGEVFVCANHYNDNGRRVIASALFEHMVKEDFFLQTGTSSFDSKTELSIQERTVNKTLVEPASFFGIPRNIVVNYYNYFIKQQTQQVSDFETPSLDSYKQLISCEIKTIGRIGSIVMNCNPFTLGHRYLVEQAAKNVLHLFVFIVEEDKSFFPFVDRIDLVKRGLADLENVSILPSGRFIISTTTFSDYFNKAELQDVAIDPSQDIEIFAKEIAPTLGISVRFAGEEPFDNVTRQYNEAMSRILPQYDIKFVEIPRKQEQNIVISASLVRKLLEEQDWEAIGKLVPQTTFDYLKDKYAILGGSKSQESTEDRA